MKKVLFASENNSKIISFKEPLSKRGIEVITLKDLDNIIYVEESGKDSVENALIKARAYYKTQNFPVFAMDNSLFIDGIPKEKQPGTKVRRVNGKRLSDKEMIEYYSNLVKTYGNNGKLNCKWVYCIALIKEGKEYIYTWYKEEFYLVENPSDKIHEGYPLDSISVNKNTEKYFTDITQESKSKNDFGIDLAINFICENL